MNVQIDGVSIKSEAEFHQALVSAFNLPAHYGANLDALWDTMTTDVERPVHLVWQNASVSRAAMPEKFESIVALLKDVEMQDSDFGWSDRFTISLNN